MSAKNVTVFLTVFLSMHVPILFFTGCNSSRELSIADVNNDTSHTITIKVRDGRVITFEGKRYSLILKDSLWAIEGEGKLQPSNKAFAGKISLDQIEHITTSEYTTFFYFVFPFTCLALSFIFLYITHINAGS